MAGKAATLDLLSQIELAGLCPVLPRYREFDVLLCSSRFEGMPVTFLEALANGVPIISTDVGGVDELIIPDKTGMIAPSSASSLGAALIRFAQFDSETQWQIREACLKQARRYSAAAMFEKNAGHLYPACPPHLSKTTAYQEWRRFTRAWPEQAIASRKPTPKLMC